MAPKNLMSSTEPTLNISLDTIEVNTTVKAIPSKTSKESPSTTTENVCGANQTYTECLNECGKGCNDLSNKRLCQMRCLGFGCTCAANFYRDIRTDRCVLPEDCPKRCPIGERFYLCGGCGPTCNQPNPVCNHICKVEGSCDCDKGLVRNIHRKCVPLSLCPLTDTKIDLRDRTKLNRNNSSLNNWRKFENKFSLREQLLESIDENDHIFN